MKISKLSELLDKVLSSIDKLSDEELQAEFDACKNGSVGRAILGLGWTDEAIKENLRLKRFTHWAVIKEPEAGL